jgi:hypothetical protein
VDEDHRRSAAKPDIVAGIWLTGSSFSLRLLTISSASGRFWRRRDESVWRVGMTQKTSQTRWIRRAIRLVPLPTVCLKIKMCTENRSFSATC